MIIPERFNGPPRSGNGGYAAAVMADGRSVEVTLRQPPPLETPLTADGDQVLAPDGSLVAELAPATAVDATVPAVTFGEAEEASAHYAGFAAHPFPTCYTCGPERPDGLRIFPGRLADGTTAAPWIVPDDVSTATIWAALDCPGGWAVLGEGRPYVLGRYTVEVGSLPSPGDRCVVRGALAGAEGRKALTYSTLYAPDGAELGRARATWIAIPG